MIRSATLRLFVLFVSLQTNVSLFAQTTPFPIDKWVKTLSAEDDTENSGLVDISDTLFSLFSYTDTTIADNCIKELENSGASNAYFKARLSLIKFLRFSYFDKDVTKIEQGMQGVLNDAYLTGDENYIAYVCRTLGKTFQYDELELTATYYHMADEIISALSKKPSYHFFLQVELGEMLYYTHEYEQGIEYIKKGMAGESIFSKDVPRLRIRPWNSIGQAYQQLGQLDSAMANYRRSLEVANELNDTVWQGINHINIAEVYFLEKDYAKAKELIEGDFELNYMPDPYVFPYGLQVLAKINLALGDKQGAVKHVRQSIQMLNNLQLYTVQRTDLLQYAYHTASDVYRALGNTDSFYHYSNLYFQLHDSLERVRTLSSIKIARLRIENEKNYHSIQQLNLQKEEEKQTRIFIIVFIVGLAVIIILVLNRQKQKLKYKEQLALQEKIAAEEQLETFTQNLIEKTALIEKLEQQVKANEYDARQQEVIKEFSNRTILTEEDWLKFKMLFEKSHPGFFTKLKGKSADITLAEQRMAALTRLRLTTKQMAAVLGISPNSVIKAKQRLRQRFELQTDFHVEEFLTKL